MFSTIEGINSFGTIPGEGYFERIAEFGFSSYHPDGCHFPRADGSVHFESDTIDQTVLATLTTRAGRRDNVKRCVGNHSSARTVSYFSTSSSPVRSYAWTGKNRPRSSATITCRQCELTRFRPDAAALRLRLIWRFGFLPAPLSPTGLPLFTSPPTHGDLLRSRYGHRK